MDTQIKLSYVGLIAILSAQVALNSCKPRQAGSGVKEQAAAEDLAEAKKYLEKVNDTLPYPQGGGVVPQEEGSLLKGQEDRRGWSTTYWPLRYGGIAYRWQDQQATSLASQRPDTLNFTKIFDRPPPSDLRYLSPAEKYDLYVGRGASAFDEAKFYSERQACRGDSQQSKEACRKYIASTNSNLTEMWMGLCDGWSSASVLEDWPGEKAMVRSRDGRCVEFSQGDLVGLLTWAHAQGIADRPFFGRRCNTANYKKDQNDRALDQNKECRDLNSGVFHVMLRGAVGKQKPLFMDRDPNAEVWNQPIIGYKMTYGKEEAPTPGDSRRAPGTHRLVPVRAEVTWLAETGFPLSGGAYSPNIINNPYKTTYCYLLEVDSNRRILGGEWYRHDETAQSIIQKMGWTDCKFDFPDFAWAMSSDIKAGGGGVDINEIRKLVAISRSSKQDYCRDNVTPPPPPPPVSIRPTVDRQPNPVIQNMDNKSEFPSKIQLPYLEDFNYRD